jgi:DNA-binding XRE family transcriptional regulator
MPLRPCGQPSIASACTAPLPSTCQAKSTAFPTPTPAQLRAARALLGWSRDELAKHSGIAAETVQCFESRGSDPKLGTVNNWRRALEAAGVRFIDADDMDGPGVRLRTTKGKR